MSFNTGAARVNTQHSQLPRRPEPYKAGRYEAKQKDMSCICPKCHIVVAGGSTTKKLIPGFPFHANCLIQLLQGAMICLNPRKKEELTPMINRDTALSMMDEDYKRLETILTELHRNHRNHKVWNKIRKMTGLKLQ